MLKTLALVVTAALGLAACGGAQFETAYDQLDPAMTAGWRVQDVVVTAPDTLTTTEQNSYTPRADIVWHGDPVGNRHAQVAAVTAEGIRQGARVLHGSRPVVIQATLTQFHALSPKTRGYGGNVGVHNIQYVAQVVDARSGAALTPPQPIKAELAALTGPDAAEADARGFTQKVEITQHLEKVTAHWLGYGPDPRGRFSRLGR